MFYFLPQFILISHLLFSHSYLEATVIQVTSNDGGVGTDGSLNQALQQAQDGDIIDCSPIAGQTIYLSSALPAMGNDAITTTPTLTIIGSGVIIDGGGQHPGFSLGQGSATISDLTIQNGLSQGGNGGSGQTGGGGGTGGGGALYVHSGSTLTISAIDMNNNQAVGGTGGTANLVGGSGGGGGGFGGGRGGVGRVGSVSGGGGGGGGNNGGTAGGTSRGAGSPNTFANFAGAGGGGGEPGNFSAGAGGSVAASDHSSAKSGGAGGQCSVSNAGGGGGGAGAGGSGHAGSNATDATSPGTGIGGQGGNGFGVDNTYGAGGGGGGDSGGAGLGVSGGGGGFTGPGGIGGIFGGGGGGSSSTTGGTHVGGNGGFGAGGGGGNVGGVDTYGLGGAGGSATNQQAGGGGGSGLGGSIFIQKGGALIIQDGISFSSNATTAGLGGLASIGADGGDGSSFGQDLFMQSGGTITFQINETLTMATPIEGAGLLLEAPESGLTKSGIGTLSLNGINTYFGDTLVQSGTINLNGSVSGNVQIQSDGTLSGNAIALGNIYNSGTISPGNSIGTVTTTDLYLYPTSVYNVEINSAGNSDLIAASGLAQLDGSVIVSTDDTNFTAPCTYTIISAGTGTTGAFTSLTSTTPGLKSLTYNSLDTQLTYLPLDAIDLTGNALSAANAFVTVPALPGSDAATINNALLALDFDDMQLAFAQMSPAQFSGPTEVQLTNAILIRSTYSKHLQKSYFHEKQGCGQPMNIWIDGFGQWQNQENSFGFDDTTSGGTLGFDYALQNWFVGGAFSVTHDDFNWNFFEGTANMTSYYGGFYARWHHHDCYLNFALIDAYNQYTIVRHIDFGTINRFANSQHNGTEMLAHAGFEYWVSRSQFQWTPYANLDYVFLHEKSYTETGAGSLDLQVQQKNSALFQGEAGIALSTTCNTSKGTFIPMLTLAYVNQTPCSNAIYYANFVNSSEVFTGTGGHYERNLFVPRFAFTYESLCDKVNVSIYYDAQIGDNYWAQDVVLDLTVHF